MPTSPSLQSIGDLTNGIKHLVQSGTRDLQMSAHTQTSLLSAIDLYRGEVKQQYQRAVAFANYGSVGSWPSAINTRSNLIKIVNGPGGVLAVLNALMDYLDEFEKLVDAAFKRVHAEDQSN